MSWPPCWGGGGFRCSHPRSISESGTKPPRLSPRDPGKGTQSLWGPIIVREHRTFCPQLCHGAWRSTCLSLSPAGLLHYSTITGISDALSSVQMLLPGPRKVARAAEAPWTLWPNCPLCHRPSPRAVSEDLHGGRAIPSQVTEELRPTNSQISFPS